MSESLVLSGLIELGKVKARIAEIQAQILRTARGQELTILEGKVKQLSDGVKFQAKESGITSLKAAGLTLYVQERSSWQADKLAALAVKYGIPESELEGCKTKSTSWAIK